MDLSTEKLKLQIRDKLAKNEERRQQLKSELDSLSQDDGSLQKMIGDVEVVEKIARELDSPSAASNLEVPAEMESISQAMG